MSVAAPDLVGCEVPRLWTPPLRELTPETSRGWEAAEFAETVLGLGLMPWQRWLFEHALELDDAGAFRFRTVIVLVARQNGKTTWVQALALWRMFVDRAALVIGTAQNLDVAEECWTGAVDMAESVPDLAAEIAAVDRTNGKKALRLVSGERYKVAAASRRGGRGLSGDLVVLDELREHQTWDAWAAVTKTTMARPRPQVMCLSNAGDIRSVVLNHLRDKGLATLDGGGDRSLGLFEWSAPPGSDLSDRSAWAQANPSMGRTIPAAAIEAAVGTDPEPVVRTEVLCMAVDRLAADGIGPDAWEAWLDPGAVPGDPVAVGVDVQPMFRSAAIVACGPGADGLPVVEVVEHRKGMKWAVEALRVLQDSTGCGPVGLDPSGPAGALLEDLARAGVEVDALTPARMTLACSGLIAAVVADDGGVWHRGDPVLTDAVLAGRLRSSGDVSKWTRTRSDGDISPLVAATIARQLWAERQAAGGHEPNVW